MSRTRCRGDTGILGFMKRWFWILDGLAVVSFVLLGRESHGLANEWGEALRVAAPFLIALGLGVAAMRAWRSPSRLSTGLMLGLVTAVVGLVMRRLVFADGTATPFVIVATAWLVATMVGWRMVAQIAEHTSARRASPLV